MTPSPLPEWFVPLTHYRFGLTLKRPPAPHITLHGYGWVLSEWRMFDVWNNWKNLGGKPPRPTNIWGRVPAWAWPLRQALLAKQPKPFPTPTPAPSPAPSPGVDLSPVRSVLILAEDPWPALNSPRHYQIWVTADLSYRDYYRDGRFVQAAKDQGRVVRSWADCKADHYTPGVGTGPADAIQMAAPVSQGGLGLYGWAGEGEVGHAFDRAYAAGCRVFVVNLSVLNDDQLGLVASGKVVVTAELYRNLQPGMSVNWRNANKGIGSNCIAVYGSTEEGASVYSQERYAQNGELPRGVSVYCGGTPKPDYAALP